MLRLGRLPLVLVLVAFARAPCVGAQEKHPVPDEAAQQAALELVRDVFKSEYEAAKTSEEKIALAKKMLSVGAATKDDTVGRFVLYRVAREMSIREGDLNTIEQAVAETVKSFQVEELPLLLESLSAAANSTGDADSEKLVRRALSLADEAIKRDAYEIAGEFGETAKTVAQRLRDKGLVELVETKVNAIEQIEAEHKPVADALATLERAPTDSEANLDCGKFYCFIKGDWERGLPMLALGSDAGLSSLARKELQDSPDRVALGDAWWKLADALEGRSAAVVRERAATHYRQALPNLSGLTKARVEANLTTYAASLHRGREAPLDLRGKRANGFVQFPVISCAQKAHRGAMGPTFDPSKSWSLHLEFLASNFETDLQMILMWGDGRPGKDPIFVRLHRGELVLAWGDARNSEGIAAIHLPLSVSDVGKWMEARLDYDRPSNTYFGYLNGGFIGAKSSNVSAFADRPMPIWIGGADAGNQRFPGSVRKIWLGNTE